MNNSLKPKFAFNPAGTGTSPHAARFDDERLASLGITSPLDLAGCTLWLDASQLTLADGDPLATWSDLSSSGFDATQSTPENRPVCKTAIQNGLRVVRFDSQGATIPQWLDLTGDGLSLFDGLSGFTLACVSGHLTSASQVIAAVTNEGTARRASLMVSSGSGTVKGITDVTVYASNDDEADAEVNGIYYSTGVGSDALTVVTAAVAAVRLDPDLESTIDLSAGTQFDGGDGIGSGRPGVAGPIPETSAEAIRIGGNNSEPGPALFDGDLMELAVWSRPLGIRERRLLLDYLSDKWGTL